MAGSSENDVRAEARGTARGFRLGRVLVIGVVVAVAAGVMWQTAIKPNVVPKNFGVVAAGKVYRSGELTPAATRRVVEREHIKTIVDLGAYDKKPELETVAARTAEALGVERHVFRLEGDGRGNPNAYVAALRILTDPAKQPVLVHCSAGSQRTSACVMLYRNIVEGKSFESVASEAFEHGHDPEENRVMMPWLMDWHDKIEKAFREGGWIAGQAEAEQFELGTKGRKAAESGSDSGR